MILYPLKAIIALWKAFREEILLLPSKELDGGVSLHSPPAACLSKNLALSWSNVTRGPKRDLLSCIVEVSDEMVSVNDNGSFLFCSRHGGVFLLTLSQTTTPAVESTSNP